MKQNAMSAERIFTSPDGGEPLVEHQHVTVVAGTGIVGDRYFDRYEEQGQNISYQADHQRLKTIPACYCVDHAVAGRMLYGRSPHDTRTLVAHLRCNQVAAPSL